MSGIIHKESLPGQGLIKRRRLDPPTTTPAGPESTSDKDAVTAAAPPDRPTDEVDATTVKPTTVQVEQKASAGASASPPKTVKAAPARQHSSSGSNSSSDEDDDDSDDEIERENARLAKLREQRSRHGTATASVSSAPSPTVPTAKGASTVPSAFTSETPGSGSGTNSYDCDVLFRNASWRNPAKAMSAEEKRREKWNSVLNRTQDSTAHKHFMKNFFK